tara:strand:- start:254 stop:1162 length:909 start_codon:yes stop_codon:yes gene_type:complete
VTTKYEFNNELLMFWNFGINKIEIVNFVFKVSIFILLIQLILSSIIVPKAQDKARSFLRTSNVNFFGSFIKAQKFNDTIKNVTIYSDKIDKNNNLYNLYLKRDITKDEFQVTYAKKGIFKEINNTPVLVLYDGETITDNKNEITKFSFSKSDFSLKNLRANTTTYKKTQEISTLNLLKCVLGIYEIKINETAYNVLDIENCLPQNLNTILQELYKRLVIPLYLPVLSIIPFLLITSSKENLNYNKLRLITFLIGLIIVIFSETTIRLISKIFIQNLGIIILPLIILTISYIMFFYSFKFKNK